MPHWDDELEFQKCYPGSKRTPWWALNFDVIFPAENESPPRRTGSEHQTESSSIVHASPYGRAALQGEREQDH